MANHKSAKKRMRQNVVRNERNTAYMSKVKTALKKFNLAVANAAETGNKDMTETEALFRSSQSLLHKAAQKGLLHKIMSLISPLNDLTPRTLRPEALCHQMKRNEGRRE